MIHLTPLGKAVAFLVSTIFVYKLIMLGLADFVIQHYVVSTFLMLGILAFQFHLPFRFYVLSYFLNWLYNHPETATKLGIRYENDETWKTNRKETEIFFTGIFAKVLMKFTGLPFLLPDDLRKNFETLQAVKASEISMKPYFDEIAGKTLTIEEFEHFLSRSILKETNRVFEILDPATEDELMKHILIVRGIVDSLTGSVYNGFWLMISNMRTAFVISRILKSVEQKKRLLLHIPQLALINNFSKMILRNPPDETGIIDISKIEPCDFLEPLSKFFTAIHDNQMVFVHRHMDRRNSSSNRAFGPTGYQCPGNVYSINFIRSTIDFLKSFDIYVEGQAKYRLGRFKNIVNKKDIKVTFKPRT